MKKLKLHLIPRPKHLKICDGNGTLALSTINGILVSSFSGADSGRIASYLRGSILKICGMELPVINTNSTDDLNRGGICVDVDVCPGINPERYSLKVSRSGIQITGASPAGAFRGAATLVQLMMNCLEGIPHLEIRDESDYRARGFYHDVTRGRVPALDTLKHIANTLAFYKINQFQLYVEHAFAFSKIPELWEGKTPLTADDIRELDKYCTDRYIDLVPSLSTFGHLYELLRLPRFEHLNELDIKASQTPRCLWDRMAHYTLDVSNPESFELVKGMIEEYLPLFSSPYFNICCDETFDLGKGKNAARAEAEGVGRLYVDFVKRVMGVVRSMGKKPMLWGDIVLKHPELIFELADDDTIFLNWEYTPEVTYAPVKTFADAGVAQYVCPGVQGWSRLATDVDRACANISRMVRYGKDAGAIGVLNTDWGDCGQVNLLSNSYHGLAFGADLSWNVGDVCIDDVDVNGDDKIPREHVNCRGELCSPAADGIDFDTRFSFLQWGIPGNRLGKILRELGGLSSGYHFGNLYAWINNKQCLWYKEDDVKSADPKELFRKSARAVEIRKELETLADEIANTSKKSISSGYDVYLDKKSEFKEYLWAASATEWLLSLLLVKKRYEYGHDIVDVDIPVPGLLVDNGSVLLEQFKALWRARNRESELCDVVETFQNILKKIKNSQ